MTDRSINPVRFFEKAETHRLPLLSLLTLPILGLLSTLLYLSLSYSPIDSFQHLLIWYVALTAIWLIPLLLNSRFFETGEHKAGYQILIWAIAFRLLGFAAEPILEDDWIRYLLDGYIFATYGNPYQYAPIDLFEQTHSPVVESLLDRISYPDIATVYGPFLESIFLLTYWIGGESPSLWSWKTTLFGFDLLFLILIYRHTSTKLFYTLAWCPLLIHSFAINAHAEIIAITFFYAAWLLREREESPRSQILCAVLYGLAVCSKITAIIWAPFIFAHLILKERKTSLSTTTSLAAFIATLALCYTPFIISGHYDLNNLLSISAHWQFNSPLQPLLSISSLSILKSCCLAAWGLFWLYSCHRYIKQKPYYPECLMFLFILCSATVNAWYMAWILIPFNKQEKPLWVWLLSITIIFSYATGLGLKNSEMGLYQVADWAIALEYIATPLLLMLLVTKKRGVIWTKN